MQQNKKPFKKSFFKYCFVPLCKNTNRNAPNKVFFFVPRGANIRRKWCEITKRGMISPVSTAYCCEDHFDLEEDTANYIEYKIMNLQEKQNTSLRLKKGILPHKIANPERRKKWLSVARRNPESIGPNSSVYMCEDHFNMEKDIVNFMKVKLGFAKKILVLAGALPSKFDCQHDRKRRLSDASTPPDTFLKWQKQRQGFVEENILHCTGQKSRRRKQILNERSKNETADCIAQTENYEPQHVLDDSTVVMMDQPEETATTTQEDYRLMHPLLELTCPEEMHLKSETEVILSDSETDDADEVIQQEVEELYTIIVNVYRFLEQEYQQLKAQCCQKCDLSTLANVARRTATAVGVTQRSVAEALKVEKRNIISMDHCYHYVPRDSQCGTKRVHIPKSKKAGRKFPKLVKLKQIQPVAGTKRVIRKRKRRTKDIVDEIPVSDTDVDYVLPKRTRGTKDIVQKTPASDNDGDYVLPEQKRRTKRIVEKTTVAGNERVLRKRKRRTKDIVDETSNRPPDDTQPPEATPPLEATPPQEPTPQPEATPSPETKILREVTSSPELTDTEFKIEIDDNWPNALVEATPLREVTPSPEATETKYMRDIDENWQKALEEAVPLREATPSPEATETKFMIGIDDNWQKAPEKDPFITESNAVFYEAPDGTQTALHVDSKETQDKSGTDPLDIQSDSLVKPLTTLGVDIKIEPKNECMEPYGDHSVIDATPQDVKWEPPED